MSLARFLFVAERPKRFDPQVIAELRGVVDDQGRSPFWDALGRHFFDLEYPSADYLSMVNKKFIADLMPTHPIYIPLLPAEAREVIGQVHEQTRPALRILEEEGFRFNNMVDIFDAGPIVACPRDQIRMVKESRRETVVEVVEEVIAGMEFAICTTRKDFRACRGTLHLGKDGIRMNSATALALNVKVGEAVRFASLRAKGAEA